MLAHIQSTQAGHPLVHVINSTLIALLEEELPEALHHKACCIGKHAGLVVVAIGMQTIYSEVLPCPGINIILPVEKGLEIHQYHLWLTRDIPPSGAQAHSFGSHSCHPFGPEFGIFAKERVLLVMPKVGTNKEEIASNKVSQGLGPGRKHRIDATHLITHLPAALQHKVRCTFLYAHQNVYITKKSSCGKDTTNFRKTRKRNAALCAARM